MNYEYEDTRDYRERLRNPMAEEAVISGLLISSGDALPEILAAPLEFRAEMLWNERHQAAFRAMRQLYEQGTVIDYVTLVAAMGDEYEDYLLSLLTGRFYSSVYVPHYASIVRQEWEKRAVSDIATQLVQDVHEGEVDLSGALTNLAGLRARSKGREMTAAEAIMSMKAQEYKGIPTGFPLLDWMTGGFIPTHFWVVDGFTSVGKTAFALNLAYQALQKGVPALYFSLEMSIEELIMRFIALRSNVPSQKIRLDELMPTERQRVWEAEDFYSRTPLVLFDDVYDIEAIAVKVEAHCRHQPGGVVFLDYLQNLRWDDMFKVMSNAATSAQALAKRAGCTVVALSQISNDEAQKKEVEQYYAQKGSGAIRDAADKVLRLRRDWDSSDMTVHVLKNRQGPAGKKFSVYFNLETGLITPVVAE